ncbi:MAG TPA: beta-L-arabinofuranosidase domain-containing protein [Puia sp.]|nr:beta-L-arabinofuranosidase domain-containing protein [Puia sp.]
MIPNRSFYTLALAGLAVLALSLPAIGQIAGGQTAPGKNDTPAEQRGNLAVIATPSGPSRSSWAVLNDGQTPTPPGNNRGGNRPLQRLGTQWVQYEWKQPIRTAAIAVYWWDYTNTMHLPQAYRVEYWDGSNFIPVQHATGLGLVNHQYNTTRFDEVKTTKLRLELDSTDRYLATLQEWTVYEPEDAPQYPAVVIAGVDRDVMLDGKTYLSGTIRSVHPVGKTLWSKATGPGNVVFNNAGAQVTTAAFSAPGDYTLQLETGEGALRSYAALHVKVRQQPQDKRLDVVYTKRYKIDSKLWNDRAKSMIVNWIPFCIDQCNRTDLSTGQGGIDNFLEAAKALRGEPHAGHKGYVFSNAWVHQTVEAMCEALMVDPQGDAEMIAAQEKMKKTLEQWIPIILSAQEPDGYLQTAFTLRDTSRWHERWSPEGRGNHEGYVSGYFIESAINHYTLTEGKDKRLYNAAKKLADCWVANIGPGKKAWFDGHQEMEQALVRFGRFVNDMEGHGRGDSYISLAKFLLDNRSGGSEYDQSAVPVQEQYEAVGHAVRATYTYSGMADVAAETGDVDYQSAVLSLWDNMVNKKYYVTGGIGSGETSEGFGPNYSLRNNAYCESCSSCGLVFFEYKMNLAYHDAKYADLYEETIYNALLGSLDLDGKDFYYTNALSTAQARYQWHVCPCCVGNIPRTLLMMPTWTYVRGEDALYVNLFVGSTIKVEKIAGTNVEMVQKTDYPWSGHISMTVNPEQSKEFTIHVRVPNRTTSELYTPVPEVRGLKSLVVHGKPVAPVIENGYAVIRRVWKKGDRIELELPMEIQKITADEKIEADRGRIALRYGPLLYNVETADHQDINQPIGNQPLSLEWKGDFLRGIMAIKGTWADGSPLLAIPNYTRMNRATPTATPQSTQVIQPTRPNQPPQYVEQTPGSIIWIKK